MKTLNIMADWDPEAQVWVATSVDVPGLVTEAANELELLAKLEVMVPELMALNSNSEEREPTKLNITSHRAMYLASA